MDSKTDKRCNCQLCNPEPWTFSNGTFQVQMQPPVRDDQDDLPVTLDDVQALGV